MTASISWTCSLEPEFGVRHNNGKCRVLIGWTHANDTLEGLQEGKVWCWVSGAPEKLQLFDSEFNRPSKRGQIRDCGVANFTMVRMFHPYWTENGKVPKDGISDDKQACRIKYHRLTQKHHKALGMLDDEAPMQYAQRLAAEKKRQQEERKEELKRRSEAAQARRDASIQKQRELVDAISGAEEIVPEDSVYNPISVDDSD